MTQKISIDQLKTGMVIIKITAQNGPVRIRKSGLVSSDEMVKALAEMGVQEVEIDPDMTVEIKKATIAKSKTQQLVEDTSTIKQTIDHGISEQFNRSLFLPSVQELPEAWQYYGKKSLITVVIIAGGFCFGLGLANLSHFTQLINNSTNLTPITQPAVVESVSQDVKINEQAQQNTPQVQVEQEQAKLERTDIAEMEPAKAAPEPTFEPVSKPIEQQQPAETIDTNQDVEADKTDLLLAQQNTEKEQQEAQEKSDIPPELLQRFRNALASIGDETPADPADKVKSIKDVPVVSKLPAWVLTELPSMAFSAHMYVSTPKDRWVRVNGKRAVEGQEIEDGLVLLGIEPQHVILKFKGQEFSMEALSDW